MLQLICDLSSVHVYPGTILTTALSLKINSSTNFSIHDVICILLQFFKNEGFCRVEQLTILFR